MTTKTCTNCPGRTDHNTAECPLIQSDFRPLAAALYQACGAYDIPERVLDALLLASEGKPTAHLADGLLPCVPNGAAPEQEAVGEVWPMSGGRQYASLGAEFMNSQDLVGAKLYTRPSAEIERLRAENKRLNTQLQHTIDQTIPLVPIPGDPKWSRRIAIDELQQKLADAQALLREWQQNEDESKDWVDFSARIDAFLSATAQPADTGCSACACGSTEPHATKLGCIKAAGDAYHGKTAEDQNDE